MLGQINGAEARQMEDHIRGCDVCQEMLQEVWVEETFIETIDVDIPEREPVPTGPTVMAPPAGPTPPAKVEPPAPPRSTPAPPTKGGVQPQSRVDTSRPPVRTEVANHSATAKAEPVRRSSSKLEMPRTAPPPPEEPAGAIDQEAETRVGPKPVAPIPPLPPTVVAPAKPPSRPRPGPVEDTNQLIARLLRPARQQGEIGWIGNFRVFELLGSGATSLVFRAEELEIHTPVALKVMKPIENDDGLAKQAFLREAKAACGIEHDHILTVFQVNEDRGIPYLVMRLLEGESLAQRLKREPRLPLGEALRIGREMALGLGAAHERGLLHRDIKPSNVWLEADTDRVKLLDFGLALPITEDSKEVTQGTFAGTPAYMAPEQARGQELDQRSDLYSLGCVLYRLVAGRAPLVADDPAALMRAITMEDPPPVQEFRPDAPPELGTLLERMLDKTPALRPASVAEVIEALLQIETDLGGLGGFGDDHELMPPHPWGHTFWGKFGLRAALAATVLLALYFLFTEVLGRLWRTPSQ
jgi:tRNA A-37 threonylcarbamoyl transferase component Bud32